MNPPPAPPARACTKSRPRSTRAPATRRRRSRGRALLRIGIAVVAFVVLIVVVNVLTSGNFFTAGNLTNVLRQITYNAILAVGQTFVIITAGIDLSVGSLIELTGVVMAQFANASGLERSAARDRRRRSSASPSAAAPASSTRCRSCGSTCRRSSRRSR